MSYQPIENYGIIGNMRTVALVGMNAPRRGYSVHAWPNTRAPLVPHGRCALF